VSFWNFLLPNHRHLLSLQLQASLNTEPAIELIPKIPVVEKPLSDVSPILAMADKNLALQEGV
jgi:hypothetical protein